MIYRGKSERLNITDWYPHSTTSPF